MGGIPERDITALLKDWSGGDRAALERLSTETRIAYFDSAARRKFRLYWTLVGPFSGLLRRVLLTGVQRRAERLRRHSRP
jgi:hypothetical protein